VILEVLRSSIFGVYPQLNSILDGFHGDVLGKIEERMHLLEIPYCGKRSALLIGCWRHDFREFP